MLFSATTVLALASAATAAKTSRTFAVTHFYGKGPLVTGRMDPVVSPGVASSHQHTVQGGSNFALTMSDTTLLESKCTSAVIKGDKSAYWTPSLFFQDPKTKAYEAVNLYYMNVYYFFDATDDDIVAFPPGLRIFVGDANKRTPPFTPNNIVTLSAKNPTAQPIQWTCPRKSYNPPSYPANSDGLSGFGIGDTNQADKGAGFPDQNCDGQYSPLRADIHLPSCYDPSKGLTDYKNNMVFPTDNGHGGANCPKGFLHVPHMFYEVYWDTQPFASRWTPGVGKQPFVLSNGDATGYSLHADFIAGWDTPVLQQIIDNCNVGSIGMEKCPGLLGGLNDGSASCNIPNAVNEASFVNGATSLPGGLSTTSFGALIAGVAAAVAPAAPAAPSTPAPAAAPAAAASPSTPAAAAPAAPATASKAAAGIPISSTSSLTPALPAGWAAAGCFSDSISARALTGKQFVVIGNHQVTTAACARRCARAGFSIAGTEYGGECFCGNTLVGSGRIEDGRCTMRCEGDAGQVCGGPLALSVVSVGGSIARRGVSSSRLHRHMAVHGVKA